MNKIYSWTDGALNIRIDGVDAVISPGAVDLLLNHHQMVDIYLRPELSQIDDYKDMDFGCRETSIGHMYPSRSASVFFILLFDPLRLFATPRSWVLAVVSRAAMDADIKTIINEEEVP